MLKSQISNQGSFSKDDDFMQSIYNKVSSLRENLELYEQNSTMVKKYVEKIQQSQTKSYVTQNKIQTFNFQPKLNLVTLNDQSNINRNNHFLKIRSEHQNLSNFSKTTIGFSTTHRTNYKQPELAQLPSKQRSISSFNLGGFQEFNKTKEFLKINPKNQQLRKRYFSSKQLPFDKQVSKKQNSNPVKIPPVQVQKGRTQNKMDRVAGFLRKYDNRSLKNASSSSNFHKKDKIETENEEVTDIDKKLENSSIQISDSYENLQKFDAIGSLKEQKKGLEEKHTFKPIGSASGMRKSAGKNQYTMNSEHESNLVARQINEVASRPETVIEQSKISSPERESAMRKNYLEKGKKFKEMLYKKLMKEVPVKQEEMVYVREYDQWVPSKLIETNKKEVENYMKMYLGEKKTHQGNNLLSLENVNLVYY